MEVNVKKNGKSFVPAAPETRPQGSISVLTRRVHELIIKIAKGEIDVIVMSGGARILGEPSGGGVSLWVTPPNSHKIIDGKLSVSVRADTDSDRKALGCIIKRAVSANQHSAALR